jgi:hypothetical protein
MRLACVCVYMCVCFVHDEGTWITKHVYGIQKSTGQGHQFCGFFAVLRAIFGLVYRCSLMRLACVCIHVYICIYIYQFCGFISFAASFLCSGLFWVCIKLHVYAVCVRTYVCVCVSRAKVHACIHTHVHTHPCACPHLHGLPRHGPLYRHVQMVHTNNT